MAYQAPPGYGAPMPPSYVPPMPTGPVIASFGRRVGGFIIDAIILGISAFIVSGPLGLLQTTTTADGTMMYTMTNSGASQAVLAALSGIYCVVSWLGMGGTPGQRVLGLSVLRASAPQRLPVEGAFIRWLILFGVSTGIGMVAIAAPSAAGAVTIAQVGWLGVLIVTTLQSPMKQGIHDKFAGSIVVKG